MLRSPLSTLAPLVILLAACGSGSQTSNNESLSSGEPSASSKGTATANGTVQEHSLTPSSAVFAYGAGNDNSIYLVLSSQDAYCANLEMGVTTPNHASLVFGLNTVTSSATAPHPTAGSFPIVTAAQQGSGNQAEGTFNLSNSSCLNALTKSGGITAGTVTLATVTSSRVAGNYNIAVGSDHVSGTFDTVYCDGLETQIATNASLACQTKESGKLRVPPRGFEPAIGL